MTASNAFPLSLSDADTFVSNEQNRVDSIEKQTSFVAFCANAFAKAFKVTVDTANFRVYFRHCGCCQNTHTASVNVTASKWCLISPPNS